MGRRRSCTPSVVEKMPARLVRAGIFHSAVLASASASPAGLWFAASRSATFRSIQAFTSLSSHPIDFEVSLSGFGNSPRAITASSAWLLAKPVLSTSASIMFRYMCYAAGSGVKKAPRHGRGAGLSSSRRS